MGTALKFVCWIIKRGLVPLIAIYIAFNLISEQPVVGKRNVSPLQIKNAAEQYAYVSQSIFGPQRYVQIKLNQQNIDDIMTAASHMIPRFNFAGRISESIGLLSGSLNLSNRLFNGYLNVTCYLTSNSNEGSIDHCEAGNIYIPGVVVNSMMNLSLAIFFDEDVKVTVNQLINDIQFKQQHVILTAKKDTDFKESVRSGLKNVASIMKTFRSPIAQVYNPQLINEYLLFIANSNWPAGPEPVSLSFVMGRAFEYAKIRSEDNAPEAENEIALWAVAIAFANPRFTEIISADTPEIKEGLSRIPNRASRLSGRGDLSLHFLYSAVMERLGNSSISVQVGELKELFDANKGGSGFDFTDLAADKAGAAFSRFITGSKANARQSQRILAGSYDEGLFFPTISGLPKPVRGEEFDSAIGSTETERYKAVVGIIEQRINNLPLYQ